MDKKTDLERKDSEMGPEIKEGAWVYVAQTQNGTAVVVSTEDELDEDQVLAALNAGSFDRDYSQVALPENIEWDTGAEHKDTHDGCDIWEVNFTGYATPLVSFGGF